MDFPQYFAGLLAQHDYLSSDGKKRLAKKLGITTHAINSWLVGRYLPTSSTNEALKQVFGPAYKAPKPRPRGRAAAKGYQPKANPNKAVLPPLHASEGDLENIVMPIFQAIKTREQKVEAIQLLVSFIE